jgi:proteasome lid subunit RPN8/RPN11
LEIYRGMGLVIMIFELTQNALSTILIDCIQYYPDKKSYKEAYGLIMGTEEKDKLIGEYTFPVGNVASQTKVSVTANNKVDDIVKKTKQLVATTACVAAYHSHPYNEYFSEWAVPSNADCHTVVGSQIKVELIVALTQNKFKNQPIRLSYMKQTGLSFFSNNGDGHEFPTIQKLDCLTQYIHGSFLNYDFEIRAYLNTGKSLQDIDLYSSEVALNELLVKEDIDIATLSSGEMYSVKKLEYSLRLQNVEKYSNKLSYHIQKIKNEQGNNEENVGRNEIQYAGSTFEELEVLTKEQIKTLAKRKALYISRNDFSDESDQVDCRFYVVDTLEDDTLALISMSEDIVTNYPLEIEELINKQYETIVGEESLYVPIKLWLKKGFIL